MSDSFIVGKNTEYISEVKKPVNKFKLLKVALVLLALIVCIQAVVYFIVLPCAVPAKIQFRGLHKLQSTELLSIIGIPSDKNWISINTAPIADVLSMNPLVENVIVEKKFPAQVLITVTERIPSAVALSVINGKTVPIQIDKNGVLFRIDEGVPEESLPVISGLTFDQPRAGMRLHSKLRPLMERLAEIQIERPEYLPLISEICIAAKEYGDYDLILYPMRSKIRVLVDSSLNDEALNNMIVALDVLDALGEQTGEVDLRYGAISYTVGQIGGT